jgi:multisubunit Na+/H+ antiporter MnhF subunit
MKKLKDATLIDIAIVIVVIGFLAWAVWEGTHGT